MRPEGPREPSPGAEPARTDLSRPFRPRARSASQDPGRRPSASALGYVLPAPWAGWEFSPPRAPSKSRGVGAFPRPTSPPDPLSHRPHVPRERGRHHPKLGKREGWGFPLSRGLGVRWERGAGGEVSSAPPPVTLTETWTRTRVRLALTGSAPGSPPPAARTFPIRSIFQPL